MQESKSITTTKIEGSSIVFFTLNFIKTLRPKQWTKNLLVFAALVFSIKSVGWIQVFNSVIGFILFSFVSGAVYVLNDFVDREQDQYHPEKKYRPMASGALNPYAALILGSLLLVGSLSVAFYMDWLFALILVVYFVINVLYTFKLKHVVIIDLMVVASGFVLRSIGGALIIDRMFTPWFLIVTMLLSLFLAISKRRHELMMLKSNKGFHRRVLNYYSPELLDQLNSIVTTATIMSYSLYTFTSSNTIHLMWTIPLVIYGIFRYLYLIHMEDKGGSPEKVLLEDKHILVTVILYGISVVLILTYL